MFAFGVPDYGFSWEVTSGIIYVFSTLWFDSGYMSVSVYEAGFAGDIAPRAVLSSLTGWLMMLGIMAGMVQEDSIALISGSGMRKARFAGILHISLCLFPCRQARRQVCRS